MDIFETQKYVWQYDNLKTKYSSFFQKEKRTSTTRKLTMGTVVLVICLAILFSNAWSMEGGGMVVCLTSLTTFIIYPIAVHHIKKTSYSRDCTSKEIAAAYKKHGNEITALKVQIDEISENLKRSDLPAQYHYSFAVNWMVKAIYSKRADTLKEVINLYEEYLQKERHNLAITEAIKSIDIIYY
ncbi:MAG: hypothetical protein IJB19_00595 [Clostridia bacterium]|nr:hypothetical protein [Clostridia bacterium]